MDLSNILHLLILFGYPLIFIITIVEGPIITIIGAFLASLGYLNIFVVYAVVVYADMVGDIFWYSLGYFGRQHFLDRFGHFIGITPEKIQNLERYFDSHAGKTLLIAKITHAVGLPFIIAAGAAHVRFKTFFWYNLLATIPKSLIFVLIGYYLGRSYAKINIVLSNATFIAIFIIVLSVAAYYLWSRFKKKYE